VLDFVNESHDILEAFQPYYEVTTVGDRAEASQLYDLQARLDGYQVYYKQEVEEFARIFYKPKDKQSPSDHQRLNSILDPAVARFTALDDDETRDEFRKVMVAYRNLYGFLSQVIPFYDTDLEKLYSFVRFLLTKLPKGPKGPVYHFDDEVALKWYRLQKISEGIIQLEKDSTGEIDGPTDVGTGAQHPEQIHLSTLIEILNERFQTDFKPGDQLFFDSIKADAVADPDLRQAAAANTIEGFSFAFKKVLEDLFIDRMDQNEDITARFLNEDNFKEEVSKYLLKEVYKEIREGDTAEV
jgi:type I restriction enzyme R subunit